MDIEKRLELILEAANYCRSVKDKGMPAAAYGKALREPIHFLWEKRHETSKEAAATYRSVKSQDYKFGKDELRYDHAIPFKYAMKEILESADLDIGVLRHILETKILTCLITKEEDTMLNQLGLGHQMPVDWDGIDSLARYKVAKIDVEKNV